MKGYKTGTICVQAGWNPENGEPRVLPIYQSTTFKYESSEQMARLFDLKEDGYYYTRLQNPTNEYVASKIAELEGGVAAMLTSSGQAAVFYAIMTLCSAGDHIVSSSALYGGTFNLFSKTLPKLGIKVSFVDQNATVEEISRSINKDTKLIFAETISNPVLNVLDIEKFSRIAKYNDIPLIVDNTFATPIFCKPILWGADIVIHSTSKYMDGHAVCLGGAIVDSGMFDWGKHPEKFPEITMPDESYHGLNFYSHYGKKAYIAKTTMQSMRDLGAVPSPQNSFLLNIGLETFHLRMARHYENALKVALFLQSCQKIAWVNYPMLPENRNYELCKKYMPDGCCGVLTFGIKGNRDTAVRFMDSLKMIAIVTHVADARSSILHPASHTHRQLSDAQLEAAGIRPDLMRLSIGIEDADDIIRDIEQALNTIR